MVPMAFQYNFFLIDPFFLTGCTVRLFKVRLVQVRLFMVRLFKVRLVADAVRALAR